MPPSPPTGLRNCRWSSSIPASMARSTSAIPRSVGRSSMTRAPTWRGSMARTANTATTGSSTTRGSRRRRRTGSATSLYRHAPRTNRPSSSRHPRPPPSPPPPTQYGTGSTGGPTYVERVQLGDLTVQKQIIGLALDVDPMLERFPFSGASERTTGQIVPRTAEPVPFTHTPEPAARSAQAWLA